MEEKELPFYFSPDYEIDQTVGRGTYNCAHLIVNENGKYEILRIALLPESNTYAKQMVVRGLHILHVLQNFAHVFGPSLLKETRLYQITPFLSPATIDNICENIQEEIKTLDANFENYEFAIQHLEYLEGGNFTSRGLMTMQEFEFCCFSLLWFFKTTQSLFGLRHRDLTEKNIVLRLYDEPQTFMFPRKNNTLIGFTSRYVPVVIDFDFASVTSTTSQHRTNVGSRHTAPPYALMVDLFAYLYRRLKDGPTHVQETLYDWWSIGIIIFQAVMHPMDDMFKDELEEFTKTLPAFLQRERIKLFDKEQKQNVELILQGICYGFCVRAVVTNYTATEKKFYLPKYLTRVFKNALKEMFAKETTKTKFKELSKTFQNKASFSVQQVLLELLLFRDLMENFNPEKWFNDYSQISTATTTINFYSDENFNAELLKIALDSPFLQLKI